jgi:tetratricopeptide (TPR) repeat protein
VPLTGPLAWEPPPPLPLPNVPWPDAAPADALPVRLDGPTPIPPDPMQGAYSPRERARNLYSKARQLHYKGLTGEAIHTLELSVQLDPGSSDAYAVWLLLGQLRMSNPAWATRSINAFQAAARIRPRSTEPWLAMGQIYQRKGFPGNALTCIQKALDLDPGVALPPEVSLQKLESELPPEAPTPTLFSRLKSMLKGSDKRSLK